MKISFITTVFNEEINIKIFINSLLNQTISPDEIIIVDGGSKDSTLVKIHELESLIRKKNIKLKILVKKGNRSVGRNEAIKNSNADIIACSDAGNILDKNWLKSITTPFKDKTVDVVAGYYKGKADNAFQKCLIPYVLVMPDKIDPLNFLPATRSVAFRKSIWEKAGGFEERLSHNEDYVFANKLKSIKAKIVFARDAVAYWLPRKNYYQSFVMFFRFALGDAESGILRSRVLMLFARYFLGLYLLFLCLLYRSITGVVVFIILLFLYLIWSVKKNYRYVKDKKALRILPLLQMTADLAVLSGSHIGFLKIIKNFKYFDFIKKNKFLFLILFIYAAILSYLLNWGIPNKDHPFPYHMDEWHQLAAVANTYRYGTPNTQGSANGTMLNFILSGFYLTPFKLIGYVDPFQLQINNFIMRGRIFEILRFQTLIFGILSILIIYRIAEIINASKKLVIFLFTFTPIWLMLSGYFKYDIALMFWLIFALERILLYAKNPTRRNYLIAAIPTAAAFSVKVSGTPMLFIYVISYFCFTHFKKKNLIYFFAGMGVVTSIIILFGMPDTLYGKGNIYDYVYANVILSPAGTSNLNITQNSFFYLISHHFFIIFGHGLMLLFTVTFLVYVVIFLKNFVNRSRKDFTIIYFLIFSFIVFLISLIPLQMGALGNRSLVLLPYFVLIIGSLFNKVPVRLRFIFIFLIYVICIVQVAESFAWINMKIKKSPQEISSRWIAGNIAKNQTIGVENIPIYQYLPDIIVKEFYYNLYHIGQNDRYKYQVIDSKTLKLPDLVVITNDEIEKKMLKISPKNQLVERLKEEKYKRIVVFSPDFNFLNNFASTDDYYLAGIITTPITISVYKK